MRQVKATHRQPISSFLFLALTYVASKTGTADDAVMVAPHHHLLSRRRKLAVPRKLVSPLSPSRQTGTLGPIVVEEILLPEQKPTSAEASIGAMAPTHTNLLVSGQRGGVIENEAGAMLLHVGNAKYEKARLRLKLFRPKPRNTKKYVGSYDKQSSDYEDRFDWWRSVPMSVSITSLSYPVERTRRPTRPPTRPPTKKPTPSPTPRQTGSPTKDPTESPTESPTEKPTPSPTEDLTEEPTSSPTEDPTEGATQNPTESPIESTDTPTESPTEATDTPTAISTDSQVKTPTLRPTVPLAEDPTFSPTSDPIASPNTESPTSLPTFQPTRVDVLSEDSQATRHPTGPIVTPTFSTKSVKSKGSKSSRSTGKGSKGNDGKGSKAGYAKGSKGGVRASKGSKTNGKGSRGGDAKGSKDGVQGASGGGGGGGRSQSVGGRGRGERRYPSHIRRTNGVPDSPSDGGGRNG